MPRHRGFTLIELMVALAVFAVILIITSMAVGGLLRMGTAEDQQNTLQQNFRFAVDSISSDARQAVAVGVPVSTPTVFTMTDSIAFEIPVGGSLTWVRYGVKQPSVGGSFELDRQVDSGHVMGLNGGDPLDSGWNSLPTQPVTEHMPELLKAYFIHAGTRLFVVTVGRMTYFGQQRTVSLVSLVYARSTGGSGT